MLLELLGYHSYTTKGEVLLVFSNVIGGKYLVFVSSRSVKMRGFSFLSLYKSVFIFQFLNDKIDQNTNFAKLQVKNGFFLV